MLGVPLHEQVAQVAVELHVPALIGGDRYGMGPFLHGGLDDVEATPVVAEVDHLGSVRLEDPPEDVDRGVVPVEEGRRRHEPDPVRCLIYGHACHKDISEIL